MMHVASFVVVISFYRWQCFPLEIWPLIALRVVVIFELEVTRKQVISRKVCEQDTNMKCAVLGVVLAQCLLLVSCYMLLDRLDVKCCVFPMGSH